ncbi:cell division protein ZapA [SCandidatus Aminicenantes bacterium Aminicenantia_JdfR_composite]|nr:cell division protein ZapA [SCandidatus Aminicenantes bacterium Aminicenantia_JdfR_composite]MCP2597061.1 cell division protein ZapA [Candidatus Aminicenantes bacterium AC-335-G13]MCP2598593.1 cell division protein ZapA [Candidatus Aminicenantes bacterium AC-335-L06]MCP2605468.1 cell division protein ZapA [Candidatus Aminicenantes bacterium AC-335-O07]
MNKIFEVEIFGEKYKLESEEEEGYILNLSSYVDQKMREISKELGISDPLKVAVLAAMSIADEKFACEKRLNQVDEAIRRVENNIENLELSLIEDNGNLNSVENAT